MITVDSVRLKSCSEMPSCGTAPYSKNSTVIPILVMHKSLHKGIKIQNVQLNRIVIELQKICN